MGKFQPGHAKIKGSGRKRGTPNKNTAILNEALDAAGLNIVERLEALLPQLSVEKQADVLVDLLGYLFPKRKATDFGAMELEKAMSPRVIVTLPSNGREVTPPIPDHAADGG